MLAPTAGGSLARLALAVEEETRLGPDTASFRITSRAGQLAHRAFGETVLVYRRADGVLLYTGSGRVLGLDHMAAGTNGLRLGDYQVFSMPVPSDVELELRDPGVKRSLSLDEARFEDILRHAMAGVSAKELAEAQALFEQDREAGIDAYLKVHDRVLQWWGHRCALTGAQFEPSTTRPHPQLRVVAIRSREMGGPLHVRNYLPMVADAERAWIHGHITLGASFGLLVSERLIDPELHEKLLALGRLDLPGESSKWPDLQAVAWHRENIFDREA